MGTLKVILKQDIPNLGEEGDIKVVKRGYARNFLFPKDLVTDYSKENIKILESKKELLEKKKLLKKENAVLLKEKLEKEKLSITVSAGEKGRLFGTITSANIQEKLKELEYNIDKKTIELKEHIKFGGKYKYRIHLYQDVYADMELEVIGKFEKPKTAQRDFKRNKKRFAPRYIKSERKQTKEVSEEKIENIKKKSENIKEESEQKTKTIKKKK